MAPYLDALVSRLRDGLGEDLLAVVLGGSAALGAYHPPDSDVDVMAVTRRRLAPEEARAAVAPCSHRELPCPARLLELVFVQVGAPRPFEVVLETGAGRPDRVALDPDAEPRFWYVLDRAIVHGRGRSLYGAPAAEVLPAPGEAEVFEALGESLDWHERHEPASRTTVLNACRAWRWARTGRWTSKPRAGEWARDRMSDPSVIDAALAREELDAAAVTSLLDAVRAALSAAAIRP